MRCSNGQTNEANEIGKGAGVSKKPTKAESEYMGRVAAMGCWICQRPAEVHHIKTGVGMGQRASNYDVIPLCPFHHRQGGFGEAIHAGIQTWQKRYGSELDMLSEVKEMLNVGD